MSTAMDSVRYDAGDMSPGNCWNDQRFAYLDSGRDRFGRDTTINANALYYSLVSEDKHLLLEYAADVLLARASRDPEGGSGKSSGETRHNVAALHRNDGALFREHLDSVGEWKVAA